MTEPTLCPICHDDSNPIDPDDGICWACQPCACGEGCGFEMTGIYAAMGVKTCETRNAGYD